MTSINLTIENIRAVKKSLQKFFPEAKSSHLSEAFAASVGFRSHAALLANFKLPNQANPQIVLINEQSFIERARALGSDVPQDAINGEISPFFPNANSGLINTIGRKAWEIEYNSPRRLAWRNMMVAGINAGIEQELFSLLPNDNRWPGADDMRHPRDCVFSFSFGDGIPAIGSLRDISYGEIEVHVALWPTKSGRQWVGNDRPGFKAGEAFAGGWLERKEGAWLHTFTENFSCRKSCLEMIANTKVDPVGFGDRGEAII